MALKCFDLKLLLVLSTSSTKTIGKGPLTRPQAFLKDFKYMPMIGNEQKPVTFRQKTIVAKESQMRRGFDKKAYDSNWDRIFGKAKKEESEKK